VSDLLRVAVGPERADGVLAVALEGELDLTCRDALTVALRTLERRPHRALELDLRGLAFMDSSGVHLLLEAHKRARAAGRRLVLLVAAGPVQRLLALSGLERGLAVAAGPEWAAGLPRASPAG
jgi:anti-anti-sigma factor